MSNNIDEVISEDFRCESLQESDSETTQNEIETETSAEPQNIAASVKLRQRALRLKVDAVAAAEIAAEAVQAAAAEELNRKRILQQKKQLLAEKVIKRQAIWTAEEVRFFFESLKIYGKNFFEISRHIRLRVRSAGVTMKTKEQVRLFYYRNWNIIKPYLSFDDLVSPLAQELYGLINYGVFRQVYSEIKPVRWQPFPKVKKRHKEKLNELVNKGCVKIKIRGKNRMAVLRTPLCQALKRLNFIETPRPLWQYPETVIVELVPRSSISFARVQAGGYNPRVRVRVSVNRQLSDVLDFLKKKWQTASSRMREAAGLSISTFPQLHIMLPKDTKIEGAVSIYSMPRSDFRNVTLESHLENLRRNQLAKAQLVESKLDQIQSPEKEPEMATSATRFEVDLRSIAEELKTNRGLDISGARQIKMLALYLALGCPEIVQLEYEYRSAEDVVQDDGSNALRRLLHLCMHEYGKMKERRSKDAELQTAHQKIDKLRTEVSSLKEQLRDAQKKNNQQHNIEQSHLFRKPRAPYHQPLPPSPSIGTQQLHDLISQVQHPLGRGRGRGRARLSNLQKPLVVQRQLHVGGPGPSASASPASPTTTANIPLSLALSLPKLTPSCVSVSPLCAQSTTASATAASTAASSCSLLDRAYEAAMQPGSCTDDVSVSSLSLTDMSFTSLLRDVDADFEAEDSCGSSLGVLRTPQHVGGSGGDNSLLGGMFGGTSSASSTPMKSPLRMLSSDMSAQVDQALNSMFSENSTDYVEKFADLAKHIDGKGCSGLTPRKDV